MALTSNLTKELIDIYRAKFISFNGTKFNPLKEKTKMTNFERIGVERQYEAENYFQARKQKEISCRLCSERGLRIECEHCHIEAAHNEVKRWKFPQQVKKYEEFHKKYGG